jgi:hypothetical protein
VTASDNPTIPVEAAIDPPDANPEAEVIPAAKPPFSDFWMKRRRENVLWAIICGLPL